MERIVSIKITSDGRAFVVDQAANADAAAKFGREVDEAGKKAETAGKKVRTVGKEAKETGEDLKKSGEGASGAGDGFKKSGDGAASATPKVKQLGDSAQRTAQQMRQVAPQITDIVTQIAGGQNPMQIFIQQGGQLKDVFGGVGPAARAVGSYVFGMINPLTLAAGAVGALAAGFLLGNEESAKFNRQLLLSGNTAGVTAGDYHQMAAGLAAIVGTKGAALEALGEMAQGGRVAATELQRYTALAQQLDRLVGKPVQETAKEFAALADSPLEASLKLTQTYNYLTVAVYEQIKALKDQGRETEAAKLAQEAFASSLEERMPKMQANVGVLARLWMEVKDAVSKAGDSLKNIGRETALPDQIALVRQQIDQAQGKDPNRRYAMPGDTPLSVLRQQLSVLEEQERAERRAAFAAAERLATVQAAARFDKAAEESLSKQEKLKRAIAKLEADGAAGLKSREKIDAAIANEKKKYTDTDAQTAHQDELNARIARAKRAGELEALAVKEGIQQIAAQYKLGLRSYVEYAEGIGDAEVRLLQLERATLAQQLADAKQKKNSRQEVANLEGQLLIKEEEIAAKRRRIATDVANHQAEAAKKARDFYREQMGQWASDLAQEQTAADRRYDSLQRSVSDYVQALSDESGELAFQVSLMGRSASAQELMIERRRTDLALRQQLRDIDRQAEGGKISGDKAEFEKSRVREAATKAAAESETRVWLKEWNYVNGQIGDGLYLALTGKGDEAKRKLSSMFEDLVLRPTLQAVTQQGTGAIANYITGGQPAAGGGGGGAAGALSNLGTAASAYSALSGIGTAFTAGSTSVGVMAGSVAGAGGMMGGIASAASAALAAIPVVGWIALAVVAAAKIFGGKGGGPKTEGGYTSGGLDIAGIDIGGNRQGSVRGNVDSAKEISQAISTGYANIAGQFGVQNTKLPVGVFFAQDNAEGGDSLTQLQIVSQNYNRSNLMGGIENVERGEEGFQKAIAESTADLFLTELQKSVTGRIGDYLKSLNPLALNADQTNEALQIAANAQKVWAAFEDLGPAFLHFAGLTVDATDEWITKSGGLEQVSANLGSFFENFYTADQKRELVAKKIAATLNAAGIGFDAETILAQAGGDDAREWFRGVVEEYAKMGAGGEQYLSALLQVNGAFASISPVVEKVTRDIEESMKRLSADSKSLQVDLLRAQGNEVGAKAQQRAIDTEGFTEAEIAIYDSNQARREEITTLNEVKQQRASLEGQLLALESSTTELRTRELAALDPANRGLQEMIWHLEDVARVAQERSGLETRLLTVQGDTTALRARELAALDPANRGLQEMIWHLEDAATVAQERSGLETRLLTVQGDTTALRARELAALDPANRGLQEMIWHLEKVATVQQERYGLETQLLTLTGDTAGLRARELALLDPSNRALQQRIWALEDAAAAANKAKDFMKDLAAEQAQARDKLRSDLLAAYNREKSDLEDLIDTHRRAAQSLRDARDAMWVGADSPLSAVNRTTVARSQYEAVYSDALGGDLEAIGKLQGAGTAYLAALKESSPTRLDFNRGFSQVAAGLTITATKSDTLAENAENQLTVLNKQLDQAGLLQETVQKGFAELLAAYLRGETVLAGGATGGAALVAAAAGATSGYWAASLQYTAGADAALGYRTLEAGGKPTDAQIAGMAYERMAQGYDVSSIYTALQASGVASVDVQRAARAAGIPGFAIGTDYVPRDMLAIIHEGERITPKAFNPTIGESGDSRALAVHREHTRMFLEMISRLQNIDLRFKKWDTIGLPPERETTAVPA